MHTSMSGGGIQAVVCNLANELSRKNINVSVCSISQPKENDIFWNKLNDSVHKFTLGKKGGGISFSIIYKIYKIIKNSTFDIVHIHGFFCYYLIAILLLHKKIKFIYTVHSDAYMENGKWDQRLFVIKKFFFKKKWIIPVTISDASQKSFFLLYGCNCDIVYNGIPQPLLGNNNNSEIEKYRISPTTKMLIHVGRIDVPKNQILLCEVIQRIINEGYDIVLLLVGGITSNEIFKNLQPLFNKRIVYLGPRSDAPQLMSQCDAMCLPSLWEGMPVVLLEAMSVGCIPICSPVGGVVNVVTHGINGILSKSSNYDDYYQAIHYFLNLNEKNRNEIITHAKESFNKYTVEIMAKKYIRIYNT